MLKRIRRAFRKRQESLEVIEQQNRQILEQLTTINSESALISRMFAETRREKLLATERLSDPKRLEKYAFKGYSQNDEDGMIQEIFRRIGTTDKRFVEFGASDGKENNSVYLLCQGWTGAWLEGSEEAIEDMKKTFGWAIESNQLTPVQSFLTKDNINDVIGEAGFQGEIDMLSIDIDGNDYHLWKAIDVVQPRLVVIEYNAYAPPPVEWIMKYKEDYSWDRTAYFNSSLQSLQNLGREKGYRLVGCSLNGLNAFFGRTDVAGDHFCDDDSAQNLYHPRRFWLDGYKLSYMIPYDRPFEQ